MAILKTKQPAKLSALAGLIGLGIIIGIFGNTANASVSGQNQLSSSNPAPNQVVSVPPTQLQLVFQNPLANPEVVTSMGLSLACNGTLVGLGVPQLGTDYKTVSAALTQIPPSGLCTVSWALPDKSLGSFSFTSAVEIQTTIAGATDGVTDADGTPSTPSIIGETIEQQQSGPRVGGILGLLRVLEYLLMSALFGGLALIVTAWPEGTTYGVTLRYMRLAWFACVVNMFLILVLSTMRAESQGFIASINPFGWFGALNTGSGAILILRFVLILACGWVAMKPERINDPASQFIAGSIIISMIGTLGLSRLGQDVAVFSYVLGIIHAIAMAYWIGGLLLLSRVVLIGPGTSDLVSAVRAFANHAVVAFGVTAFTGASLIYLLDSSSIFTSGHGRIAVFKLIFVSVMVYITLLVKQFAAKRLVDGDNLSGRMAWRLRRAVSVELAFALIALMFTSWLAATTPPKAKAEVRTTSAIYSFREELKNDRFHVVISLTPGVTGTNAMRIELIEPRRINNFAVKMVPQAIGFAGIQINVPLTRPGAAIVQATGRSSSMHPAFGISKFLARQPPAI